MLNIDILRLSFNRSDIKDVMLIDGCGCHRRRLCRPAGAVYQITSILAPSHLLLYQLIRTGKHSREHKSKLIFVSMQNDLSNIEIENLQERIFHLKIQTKTWLSFCDGFS
jgi:hypothetical protein